MKRDIELNAEGTTLRGWLHVPSGVSSRVPLVVMAHGWGAVKEMYLDEYAAAFAAAGIAALVFDHRNFGASDGEPRQEIDPWAQVRDYRHAITFAQAIPGVDRDRIGVWGTSYSGGHALVLGAIDRRVRCVVAQCPTISGWRNMLRRYPGDRLAQFFAACEADRAARFRGEPPRTVPIAPDFRPEEHRPAGPGPAARAGNDGGGWFGALTADRRAAWRNEVTLRSVELYSEYEPGTYISRIGPTPLLIVTADADSLTPTDEILGAYDAAREPKKLVILPGGHFDLYGAQLSAGSAAATEWFALHLNASR
ncbi:MAG: alpha/beta hydrolase [Polyangiaceae bacterium]|nr:alpha/beta hydrolase [Polyangiaceae bacterium]